jgi:hypothetical protein
MSRAVYLHIGAPKTGTTYLQDRLTLNARALAAHDVHFPTGSPLVSPALFQFRAALDLLGQDWGGAPGHASGSWDALVRRVRRRSGTVIISHEILAPATPERVAKVMSDLAGAELHVVYSARDLARQLPAAWQESIKQGRRWTYRRFLDRAERRNAWFYRAFDLPTVLGTWGAALPPERIHVVTVPPSSVGRERPDLLWRRFCEAFGIDPAWAPLDSDRTNRSLGIAETQVVRKLNRRMGSATPREARYDRLIREILAQEQLVKRTSLPVRLPPARFGWVAGEAERWLEWIRENEVHVVGDVADLRPLPPSKDQRFHDPDRIGPRRQLSAALDALVTMTQEAASRPDPEGHLVHRIRARARQAQRRARGRSSRSA